MPRGTRGQKRAEQRKKGAGGHQNVDSVFTVTSGEIQSGGLQTPFSDCTVTGEGREQRLLQGAGGRPS